MVLWGKPCRHAATGVSFSVLNQLNLRRGVVWPVTWILLMALQGTTDGACLLASANKIQSMLGAWDGSE